MSPLHCGLGSSFRSLFRRLQREFGAAGLDRQLGSHGTLRCPMGLRGRQAQLGAEGCIGGSRAWVQGQALQALNQALEGLNAQAIELEATIASNVAGLLEA
jgi:hypothetical protein